MPATQEGCDERIWLQTYVTSSTNMLPQRSLYISYGCLIFISGQTQMNIVLHSYCFPNSFLQPLSSAELCIDI